MTWIRKHLRDKPHWVYRLYSPTDELLYVGCTSHHPTDRITGLRKDNPVRLGDAPIAWWYAEQFPNGIEGEAAEGQLIDDFSPRLNGMRSGVTHRKNGVVPSAPIATASGLAPR